MKGMRSGVVLPHFACEISRATFSQFLIEIPPLLEVFVGPSHQLGVLSHHLNCEMKSLHLVDFS